MIKKLVRVLELFGGAVPRIIPALERRYAGHWIDYVGVNRHVRGPRIQENTFASGSRATLFAETLDFNRPTNLREQLVALLGKSRFKEIHIHLPTAYCTTDAEVENLKVIADFLEDGGHLYHTFDFSPLFRVRGFPPKCEQDFRSRYLENQRGIATIAASAGLELQQYGMRGSRRSWRTLCGPLHARSARIVRARLREHTRHYDTYAYHYVVLRKPRPG